MAMLFIAILIGVATAAPWDDDCIEPVSDVNVNFLLQVEKQRKFARGAEGHLTGCGRLINETCDPTANNIIIAKCILMGRIAIGQFQR